MIHVFIGTKAQYIKTAPLMRLLDQKGIGYNFIDSGQHARFSIALRQELNIREADVYLKRGGDVDTLLGAFRWMGKWLLYVIFKPQYIREHIFKGKKGVCVVHGDTPSTLIAVLMAKRVGIDVAHIEAGLRSYNYVNPFPEEIIRIIAMKLADYLFTPHAVAAENLKAMRVRGETIHLGVNTNIEALQYSLRSRPESVTKCAAKPYALIIFHRVETVLSRPRVDFILDLMERISRDVRVVFVAHSFTKKQLTKMGMLDRITRNSSVTVKDLMAHDEFLGYLNGCEFVITDGGSIQEETYYLDKPCLVMRRKTERAEGLGENVMLSNFDLQRCDFFITHYKNMVRKKEIVNTNPSEVILQRISAYA